MCDVQPFVFFILSVRIWPSKIIRSWSVDDQFSTFQLREARHQAESSNKSGYYRSVDQKSTTKLPLDSRARREFRSISRKSIFLIIANNIIPRRGRMEPRSSTSFHLQPLFETIRKFSETKEGSRVNVDYAIIRRNTAILKSLFSISDLSYKFIQTNSRSVKRTR